ncbi:MAG: glycosyltransferase [Gemmataceae bacterium]|nr:glycosyltransferase [Gemmataceae bacterium]
MDDVCDLSLILPAYNEEAGIAQAVAEADEALRRLGVTYEIIVVDDGSSDRTSALVEEATCTQGCVRLVRHDVNRGYGAALRTGFAAARGQRIAFTDADCQFHLDDLALLLPLTEQNPIAVGYRVDRQDSWLRKFYSRGYNLLARCLLGTRVRDIDCALKVFRRDALAKILPDTAGFFVNTEMLTKARAHHLAVAEVAVRHRPRQRGESKVSLGDIPRTLNALLPFWWMKVMFPGTSDPAAQARQAGASLLALRDQGMPMKMLLTLGLLLVTSVLFFARLDHALLEPEEARYAEIPRQMLLEGRLLTPVLHGEDYWQKPPLLYWLVMASYQIFGVHDWAARLIPCLAGIGCVAITFGWGWRTLGFWPGMVSGSILTLSARFLYLSGMLTMDGLLCVCVLAGLACGHLALTEGRLRWLILAAHACALGILTKGPVALLLIAVPLLALAFLDRRCRLLSKVECCIYLGIVLLVAGPWFVVMAWQAPGAAGTFFWLHNLTRYLAPLDHEKPAWFYVPSLLLGMLPWTLLLVPLLPYLARRSQRMGKRRPAALGVFVLAFLWCVLFFSASGCKRPGYILPAFPLLALVLGTFVTHGLPWLRWLQAVRERSVVGHGHGQRWALRLHLATVLMGVTVSLASGLSGLWAWPGAGLVAALFVAVGGAALCAPACMPAWAPWTACGSVVCLFLGISQTLWLPDYHHRFGLRRQVEISSAYEQEEELPILSYPKRWDSVAFYSQRSDVESYTPAELTQLMHDLAKHGKALIFVRRERSLHELLAALPEHLEIEFLGNDDDFIAVGLVRPRKR